MSYFLGNLGCNKEIDSWVDSVERYFPLIKVCYKQSSELLNLQVYSDEKYSESIKNVFFDIYIDGYIIYDDYIITNKSGRTEKQKFVVYVINLIQQRRFEEFNLLGGSFLLFFCMNGLRYIINDNLATRKLYYYVSKNEFCFSSDLRLLLCNKKIPYQINEKQCQLFCSSVYTVFESTINNDTFFKDIYKLKPGTINIFDGKEKTEISYFQYYDINRILYSNDEPNMLFRNQLNKINRTILSCNECNNVGISLSGGLDSAVVLASLLDVGHKERVKAYHVSFRDSNLHQCSDFEIVRKLAKDTGVDTKILFADDSLRLKNAEIGRDKLSYIDGPAMMGNELVYDMLAPVIRNDNVNQLFTGDGGDYLFMGTKYCGDYFMRQHLYKEAMVRSNKLAKSSSLIDRIISYGKYNIVPFLPLVSEYMYKDIFWRTESISYPEYLSKKIIDIGKEYSHNHLYSKGKRIKDWHRRFIYDFLFPKGPYTEINIDSFTFQFPLEDNSMFRTILSIPPQYHYDIYEGGQGQYLIRKKLLRTAFSDILPEYITKQKNKTLYGNMHRHIIYNERNNLLELFDKHSSLCCEEFGIIKSELFKERIKSIVNLSQDLNFVGGADVNYYTNIIQLEIWLRIANKGREYLLKLSDIGRLHTDTIDIEEV